MVNREPNHNVSGASSASAYQDADGIARAVLHAHVVMIHNLAAPLAGKGKLIVASFGQDPATGIELPAKMVHVRIGDIDGTVAAIRRLAQEPHRNVYMPFAVMRPDLPRWQKGEEADVRGVLALVSDFDDADAANYAARLPVTAPYVINSSAGRFQTVLPFDQPVDMAKAKTVAIALKQAIGVDHCSVDMSHVWRVPGLLNWPSKKKVVEDGRSPDPQPVLVEEPWDGSVISLEELRKVIPVPEPKTTNGSGNGNGAGFNFNGHAANPSDLPDDLIERMKHAPPEGQRSEHAFGVFCTLVEMGWSDNDIFNEARKHATGFAEKYVGNDKPLRAEITRARDKAKGDQREWSGRQRQDQKQDHRSSGSKTPPAPWPVPDLAAAHQNRRAPPTLPVDVFGTFWADWLTAAAEGASCPIDYVAGPFLAAAAMLIGNARWVSPWGEWKDTPVLWIANVGDPSSGKSPGADPVLDILSILEAEVAADFEMVHREWDTAREAARCARESWEKDVKTAVGLKNPPPIKPANAVEPPEPVRARIKVGDATSEALGAVLAVHPKGVLYFRDELAGWFGSFDKYGGNGSDRAFWIEAYGGRRFTIDRVKHPLPITIPHLSVGVLGGVQPERLTDLLNSPDDGLQARFLWFWPDKVPPCRPTHTADGKAALEAFRRLIELPLVPGDKDEMRPFICTLTDDAADAFHQWRAENSVAEVSGMLAGAYGKAPGHLLRLALILEHLWWCAPSTSSSPAMPPGSITVRAVNAAAGLIEDYFKPMAERVFGDAALPEVDRLAATLARWIMKERPKLVNARDLRRKARLPGLRDAAKVKLALAALVEADWLRHVLDQPGEQGGRPREDYEVNPRLWEARHAQ